MGKMYLLRSPAKTLRMSCRVMYMYARSQGRLFGEEEAGEVVLLGLRLVHLLTQASLALVA